MAASFSIGRPLLFVFDFFIGWVIVAISESAVECTHLATAE